jgi:hypothetical protein
VIISSNLIGFNSSLGIDLGLALASSSDDDEGIIASG